VTVSIEDVISDCLKTLDSCSTGTAIYILSCLCPEDIAVLELVRLDLSQPHQHKPLAGRNIRPEPHSYEDLLSHLQARTSIVPAKDLPHLWIELTRNWLITCPVDPDYYRDDEAGKELFCQKLRNELVDRILNLT
jgi:hypothetical protein